MPFLLSLVTAPQENLPVGILKREFMFSSPFHCSASAPKATTAVLGGGARALADGEKSGSECRELGNG